MKQNNNLKISRRPKDDLLDQLKPANKGTLTYGDLFDIWNSAYMLPLKDHIEVLHALYSRSSDFEAKRLQDDIYAFLKKMEALPEITPEQKTEEARNTLKIEALPEKRDLTSAQKLEGARKAIAKKLASKPKDQKFRDKLDALPPPTQRTSRGAR